MLSANCSTSRKCPVRVADRIVGYLEGDSFHKSVKASIHQLRTPPAWCVSKDAFYQQILPNAKTLIIEDKESGLTYKCPASKFADNCFEVKRGGFEPQLGLALKHWEVEGNGDKQLSLWGGAAW